MDDFQGGCKGATSAALYTCLGLRLRLRMGMLSMDMQDSVGERSPSLAACTMTLNLYHVCIHVTDTGDHLHHHGRHIQIMSCLYGVGAEHSHTGRSAGLQRCSPVMGECLPY